MVEQEDPRVTKTPTSHFGKYAVSFRSHFDDGRLWLCHMARFVLSAPPATKAEIT